MIHRSEHEDNYTILPNEIIRDSRLSGGAFQLLAFMLSCSDDFSFNIKGLATCLKISVGATAKRVKELEEAGYIVLSFNRDEAGRMVSCSWDIYETPIDFSVFGKTEFGKAEFGKTEFGKIERIRNTNSKEIPNIRNTNGKKYTFEPPTVEQVRAYVEEKKFSVDPEQFVSYYTSIGWKVGKSRKPMEDWKAAVRTWERKNKQRSRPQPISENPFTKLRREEGYE